MIPFPSFLVGAHTLPVTALSPRFCLIHLQKGAKAPAQPWLWVICSDKWDHNVMLLFFQNVLNENKKKNSFFQMLQVVTYSFLQLIKRYCTFFFYPHLPPPKKNKTNHNITEQGITESSPFFWHLHWLISSLCFIASGPLLGTGIFFSTHLHLFF